MMTKNALSMWLRNLLKIFKLNNLLGIDFGERFIGLAIKKHNVPIPYAHKIIDTRITNLISELKQIAREEHITKIIVGYPKGLMNKQTRMSILVNSFINNDLKNNFDIPIVKVDERLTSKILHNDSNKRVDDLSAVKILETYCSNE